MNPTMRVLGALSFASLLAIGCDSGGGTDRMVQAARSGPGASAPPVELWARVAPRRAAAAQRAAVVRWVRAAWAARLARVRVVRRARAASVAQVDCPAQDAVVRPAWAVRALPGAVAPGARAAWRAWALLGAVAPRAVVQRGPAGRVGRRRANLSGAAGAQTPTVYVIGDSTASVYASNLYPRMGWAQPLQDYFAPACVTVQDKALSGRSSKSFYDEGDWTPIRNALRKGDYVLIQFGHNDEKSDQPTLYTDPFTTYEQYLSHYIDDTQAKGATPILITSINRNDWSGTTLQDTHGNYPVAMRQLAQAREISLVDATALTKTYFERIGQTATTLLFMDLAAGQFPNYPSGNTDNTHLQERAPAPSPR